MINGGKLLNRGRSKDVAIAKRAVGNSELFFEAVIRSNGK